MTRDLLDVAAVCKLTGLKPQTIRAYLRRGSMPAPDYRLGGRPVWEAWTIERWERKRQGVIETPVDF